MVEKFLKLEERIKRKKFLNVLRGKYLTWLKYLLFFVNMPSIFLFRLNLIASLMKALLDEKKLNKCMLVYKAMALKKQVPSYWPRRSKINCKPCAIF